MRSIVVLALITAISLFGDSMLYVVLPIHWKDVGLISLIEVGILLSANRFIRLPLGPVIGWLYQKLSIRSGVLIAVCIAAVTTFLYGWVEGFYLWLLLRCVWGIAWSFLRLGAYFMILENSDSSNRGHFMGTYNGLYRLGSLVGMLVGSIGVEMFGIQVVASIFGLLALITLPAVYIFVPHVKGHQESKGEPIAKREIMKIPMLQGTLLTVFLVAMCLEGMLTATLSHLIEMRHQVNITFYEIVIGSATVAGALQAVRWGLGSFLSPWFGRLSDRKWGRRRLLIGLLGLAALLIAITNTEIPYGLWLLNILILLIVANLLSTIMDALASDITVGATRAFIMTLYVMMADVGASMGPLLGYVSEHFIGISMTYWISAAILVMLGLAWFISGRRGVGKDLSVQG
ncbi:MFS transporter [Paenibacillus sp. N1-5-1-14]|uniref:MFS transporter n=1 Tax=Paenibacillus radicibacter TaxID=2972488 RepID=UPI0021597525|nr:MFS transporter [Paenibacillus radicibacter]MCR8643253.1 MFS transporter [Paenibacillus radicibacter]